MDESSYGRRSGIDNAGAFEKITIRQLHNAPMYPVLTGVVIAKCDPKFVATKKGGDRYVFNFTLRDSPADTANASCWGDEVQVKAVCEIFSIGDVVCIKNPQIVMTQSGSAGEKYRPFSTSLHELIISPWNSEITLRSQEEGLQYQSFIHYPLHPADDYKQLADIIGNRENADGTTNNLLVVVKKVGTIQLLKTKDGRQVNKLELEVCDRTHPSFQIVIWDKETAQFINNRLHPKGVVLISDVRVNFSRYTQSMVGTAVSNTVFTPDPAVPDGLILYQYFQSLPDEEMGISQNSNDKSITYTVDNVQQILTSFQFSSNNDIEGTLYAYISHFDIDGSSKVISNRCPECKLAIRESTKRCTNGNCEVGAGMKSLNPEEVFDITANLTDHTGTLFRCIIYSSVVQDMLKYTASEFQRLSDNEKTTLKWKFLMEFFEFKFKIPRKPASTGNPIVYITSCQPADLSAAIAFYKST